ncbi:MAG: hypothetical protein ACLFMT_03640 [Halobacteriales archaeon]
MTERAVRSKLLRFVHVAALHSLDELDPFNVINVDLDMSSSALKEFFRSELRQETARIKARFQEQTEVIVDYAAEDGGAEDYLDDYLASDLYYQAYDGEKETDFRDDLLDYLRTTGDNLRPVVESPEDDFWDAVLDVYTGPEALEVFDYHFDRSRIVRDYVEGLDLRMQVDTGLPIGELEYTEESLRIYASGEDELRRIVRSQLSRRDAL